ncbi:MAG: hypothetical protein AAF570_13755, partial [Bacteroidota bacterium]
VVFFLSPYIKDHIYDDIQRDLQLQTQQIANQTRDDYLKIRQPYAFREMHPSMMQRFEDELEEKLKTIEKAFFNDVNIYFSSGRLHMSTQPAIYEMGLTSEYMNPNVYLQMRSGRVSDIVV